MIQRIAITGSSGYYGRALVDLIRRISPGTRILGVDVASPPITTHHGSAASHGSPAVSQGPDEFLKADITSHAVTQALHNFRPDTVVHLAFVVNPMRDERRMRQINVEGTRQLLQACQQIRPERVLIGSSATAYGAWDDNPVPMAESYRLKARSEYRYAADKVEVEGLLEDFRRENPTIRVAWTRPCMIYGPGLSNYLTRFILEGPIIVLPGGNNTEFQFVHVDDVANATWTILQSNAEGPFNVAPPDWFNLTDLARLSGRRTVRVPLRACLAFTKVWWGLRLPKFHFPSGLWYFIRYPWVIEPVRLQQELSFQFQYSSHDVIRKLLHDAGKLLPEPPGSGSSLHTT